MARKKKVIEEEEKDDAPFAPIPNEPPVIAMTREAVIPPVVKPVVKPAETIPAKTENPYYKETLWHGIKEVYQCNKCGVFREKEDAMIVHVVIHVPRLEQNALLDELMKGYKT